MAASDFVNETAQAPEADVRLSIEPSTNADARLYLLLCGGTGGNYRR